MDLSSLFCSTVSFYFSSFWAKPASTVQNVLLFEQNCSLNLTDCGFSSTLPVTGPTICTAFIWQLWVFSWLTHFCVCFLLRFLFLHGSISRKAWPCMWPLYNGSFLMQNVSLIASVTGLDRELLRIPKRHKPTGFSGLFLLSKTW